MTSLPEPFAEARNHSTALKAALLTQQAVRAITNRIATHAEPRTDGEALEAARDTAEPAPVDSQRILVTLDKFLVDGEVVMRVRRDYPDDEGLSTIDEATALSLAYNDLCEEGGHWN